MAGIVCCLLVLLALTSCRSAQRDPKTVVFLIESSPTSLDPRIGTDIQSEHIDEILFDGLVERAPNFTFQPALAQSWDQSDPKTLIFHLRPGVKFHSGQPLTSRDVKWTIDSMRNGTVTSAKAASYVAVDSIETPDPLTVVFHLKKSDNFLLLNLSTGAMGIVPYGSGKDFWRNPIGTGPFRFVSQQIDQDVLIERNPASWKIVPKIDRVRFAVVPDIITEALELEKGSADVTIDSQPMDALPALASRPNLQVTVVPGTKLQYLAFNLTDPLLKDVRVRQAISCAIDRDLLIRTLMNGHARPAKSLLPTTHWAFNDQGPTFSYNPARAEQLLDDAGYPRKANGIRLRLTMKTSSVEDIRLLAAVFQQQLAAVGIQLDIRTYEFATFYADVLKGAFQLYSLRWIGGNEQPDIFTYAFSSSRFPPKGANRGHYSNPKVDALLDEAWQNPDQSVRKADYAQAQQILATDLPAINLWYRDTVVVHNKRLKNVTPTPSGSFTFLETAELTQ